MERFKLRKLSSGIIKARTWEAVYRRPMAELLAILGSKTPPSNPRELLEAVTARWSDQTRLPWPADAGAADRPRRSK